MLGNDYIPEGRPKQVGLVVLQADETLEVEFRRLMPPELEYLVTRVPSPDTVSRESLRSMETALTEAAARLPRGAVFSAVGYGCTSASAELGAARVHRLIQDGADTPAVTEPLTAIVAACRALGVSRPALVSPYVPEVALRLSDALERHDIHVSNAINFNEEVEVRVVRIPRSRIVEAAIDVARASESDAVILSCTNLRTLDTIVEIERVTGKPVVTSNQALAWHLCQLSSVVHKPAIGGRLFS